MESGLIVPATPERTPRPFRIRAPQGTLDELRNRLAATRFPDDPDNDDWDYGFPTSYLRELVDHWRVRYDWRATEARMNELEQYAITVDGANHHVFVARGTGPAPLPLILSHGWPWTAWDFQRVIGRLSNPASHGGDASDSFDVVVPSLPGFGFSGPTDVKGWNFWHAADAQVGLMRALGYERFAAADGDIGSLVVAHLGHAHADSVIGVYTHLAVPMTVFQSVPDGERPLDAVPAIEYAGVMPAPSAFGPGEERWSVRNYGPSDTGYSAIQLTKPQSLATAMNDSPAGLAAWVLEKRHSWGDVRSGLESVFSKDDLCDIASINWLTGTYASSARYYANAVRDPWHPRHERLPRVEVPSAVSVFTEDIRRPPRAWVERYFDLRQWREYDRGGHFAPFERPDAFVADVRDFFRTLR
jgi:pimeloyl-ACP methyl ester carboxylesterase